MMSSFKMLKCYKGVNMAVLGPALNQTQEAHANSSKGKELDGLE